VARRFGDFALGCIAVSLERRGGLICDARVAVMGVDETPRRLREAEAVLRDARGEVAVFKRFSEAVRRAVSPPSDIHVSSDYRRALIGLLAERVTAAAWTRAAGAAQ
jgi:carbon-monoxide dehydrogenase medium subunit